MLQNIKKFRISAPSTPEQLRLSQKRSVMFLTSEDGQDWYECQKLFQPDTIKLCFDDKNIIRSISSAESGHDVSGLWPAGYSVAEVKNTTANRRADILGGWLYIDGEIIRREATKDELLSQAESEKANRLADASAAIAILADAVELELATDEEAAYLKELKKFRVLLMRVDTSEPVWPEVPERVA